MRLLKYIRSIKIAATAAAIAHDGQYRKHTSVPYIAHPARVAQLVALYDNTEYLGIITAWLHDVLEDCGSEGAKIFEAAIDAMPLDTEEKIEIINAVGSLTKNDDIHPRAAKNTDVALRLVHDSTPRFAVLVKICDRIDNITDMDGFKEGFMRLYLMETNILISYIESLSLDIVENEALADLKEEIANKENDIMRNLI
jgi:(p)ppGpp synthase/HD superfamily hydrolase